MARIKPRLTFTSEPFKDEQPTWSRDALKVAFVSTRDSVIETWQETDDDGNVLQKSTLHINKEIYLMNADGSNQTRLTNTFENEDAPAWSPDNTKIVFHSDRERDTSDSTQQLWTMYPDGTNQSLIASNEFRDYSPSWSNNIANQSPVANSGGPYSGAVAQNVPFSGAGSFDPDGTIVSYAWTFGDGGSGSGATPTHSYASTGTYNVTLTGQLGKEGSDSNAHGSGWTLFGSPQGFVGGEGKLTSAVVANPSSVILLDEIEKGSPELLDLFLAILDEGSARDNRTNAVVDFYDCIIFFTSNLVTAIPPEVHADPSLTRDLVLDRGFFKTEMINRISHVIPMKCLETTALRAIALDLMEPLLSRVVGASGHKIVDRGVIEAILKQSDTKYGARDLQRVVDEIVGDPLTDAVFGRDDMQSLRRVSVRLSNGRIRVEVA